MSTVGSMTGPPAIALDEVRELVTGLDHPECVAWGPDGNVYAGGEAGQIYRISLEGELHQVGSTGGFVLGLCLDADRNVYACDRARREVVKITPRGDIETYSSGPPGARYTTPNYPVFGPSGHLYVTDSGSYGKANGRLTVIAPDRSCDVVTEELREFPNGLALTPDGRTLYVALSTLPGVAKIGIRDARLTEGPDLVASFPGMTPDGLALAADGSLLISFYTPDVVMRVVEGAPIELVLNDPRHHVLASPTNIAFGGPDLSRLFIGSFGRWHIGQVDLPFAGAGMLYPDLAAASHGLRRRPA